MTTTEEKKLNRYIVLDDKASNYYQFAAYTSIEFWTCDGCKKLYSFAEDYRIITDYSSFESNISSWYCRTNCGGAWEN